MPHFRLFKLKNVHFLPPQRVQLNKTAMSHITALYLGALVATTLTIVWLLNTMVLGSYVVLLRGMLKFNYLNWAVLPKEVVPKIIYAAIAFVWSGVVLMFIVFRKAPHTRIMFLTIGWGLLVGVLFAVARLGF